MARMFRPIPKAKLSQSMTVRQPLPGGGFGEPVAIVGVMFERCDAVSDDAHRSAAGGGTVFVDAVNSRGAFEVPVGSRVAIGGHSYYVRKCVPLADLFGRIHHWELEVG